MPLTRPTLTILAPRSGPSPVRIPASARFPPRRLDETSRWGSSSSFDDEAGAAGRFRKVSSGSARGKKLRDMRRINPHKFQIATRGTSREINRQIALNLIHTHQPISRADLARLMGLRRGAVSLIINELLKDGAIFEGMTGEVRRGRKPTFLYIDSRGRSIVGVDIRVTRTFIMVTDRLCRPLVGPINFPTDHNPEKLVAELSKR